jgi:uncharacterized RDD family membrane protein YckC
MTSPTPTTPATATTPTRHATAPLVTAPKLVVPERDIGMQGHYAGAVSRLASFLLDAMFASIAFWLFSLLFTVALNTLTGSDFDPTESGLLTTSAFVVWAFVYAAYPQAVAGRTLGMAIVGLAAVDRDGSPIRPWQAVVRVLAFPLSFLLFGLGFIGIVLQREHRALHDLIAGTAVVYAWNARAARLRFIAQRPT